ncbi:MAG: NTP transferase domain-containing protein [Thermomicrobiales bacterium]
MNRSRTVWAVILAAGTASRAGSTKQLLELQGKPLLQHVIDNARAANVDGVVLVLGHDAERVRVAIDPGHATVVINPHYASGQASSLIAGVTALPPVVDAAVVLLGDQPGVTNDDIDQVVDAWKAAEPPLAVPYWQGDRGNPVVFARSVFPEIQELTGDTGARAIFRKYEGSIVRVAFDRPMPPDVDTPADYISLVRGQEK